MSHRRSSTLLEVEAEAADYFSLDPNQVSLFTSRSSNDLISATHHFSRSSAKMAPPTPTRNPRHRQSTSRRDVAAPTKTSPKISSNQTEKRPPAHSSSSSRPIDKSRNSTSQTGSRPAKTRAPKQEPKGSRTSAAGEQSGGRHVVCCSPSSTNSLPSISSSPSVSPSLVCPHLSLDDLLTETRPENQNVSPHTIGLCPKCRLDPPPNVHSPLSPIFRPTKSQLETTKKTHNISPSNESDFMAQCKMTTMRRVHSDHQASDYSKRKGKARQQQMRDDSLDYYLPPDELRRLQMSPTLRNSVEFIRKNSIESGRVVRIYKNGQPYDRPLRVCIMRGEFSTLNHLLDHINGRQLIPLGARYLFHLDGQLVYSVHELKHGSIYVVSGVRSFDYRASAILKEQHKREQTGHPKAPTHRRQPLQSVSDHHLRSNSKQNLNEQPVDEPLSSTGKSTAAPNAPKRRLTNKTTNQVRTKQAGEMIYSSMSNLETADQESHQHQTKKQFEQQQQPPSSRITRAKSELADLPNKRKKNVTFMDTGRGSSPTIMADLSSSEKSTELGNGELDTNNEKAAQINESIIKELNTNEIGIQVSDSIDGFLIDLPIAMPAKGDDSNLRGPRTTSMATTTNRTRPGLYNRRQKKVTGKNEASRPNGAQVASGDSQAANRRKVVTITERQLSLDEMSKFKELSHGDHHNELNQPEIKIDLDNSVVREDEDEEDEEPLGEKTVAKIDESTRGELDDQHSDLAADVSLDEHVADVAEKDDDHWQYPAGRESSATPTERPVSQSGPNESVRARVTTPSPSLSTLGDNNSLSMSLDQQQSAAAAGGPESSPDITGHLQEAKKTARQQVEVKGELCPGLEQPDKNFKLVWVNGFIINDQYPENCANPAQQLASGSPTNRPRGGQTPELTGEAVHLSPRYAGASPSGPSNQPVQFKSSERFHNWICYSQKYDELVYPAGSLVVLWCKWTEVQRYYSKHTSNVSSLALSTLDLSLAGSAQVTDSNQKPTVESRIHLWSLETLETLLIIDDDQFRNKRIFSLRLRNAPSTGCQLTVGARDDKQLCLFTINRRLKSDSSVDAAKPAGKKSRNTDAQLIKTAKVLQSNQQPLVVMSMPLTGNETFTPSDTTGKIAASKQTSEPNNQLLLSFGRRHFNLWLIDRRQSKVRPMQAENKSAKFVEMIIKANCLVKLEPNELLIGDSDGNLALILLDFLSQQQHQQQAQPKQALRFPLGQQTDAANELKYGIKTITLLDPNESTPRLSPIAITCLTRITGSLFMTADSNCTLKFWQIKREKTKASDLFGTIKLQSEEQIVSCQQVGFINLPADLGLICTIILARYDRKKSLVEFYLVSTSNTILFGTSKLDLSKAQTDKPPVRDTKREESSVAANSTLSVVYEGHETAATCLVADVASNRSKLRRKSLQLGIINSTLPDNCYYFTCSLDSRICKWNGHKLVWKSLLPSPCASLAIHPTGFVLAVGSTDGTVYVLDKVSGLLVSYFPLTPVRINCLAYSRDGLLLAAGCANGSIFILPVYERGLIYKKVSIFQSPYAVVSLQFSTDNRYMLTSVTHGSYQELILWDLPNFRYMRDNVKVAADKIQWFDSICSGSEDVRAIWENANLASPSDISPGKKQLAKRMLEPKGEQFVKPVTIVNLSCHRLVLPSPKDGGHSDGYAIASDTSGNLRLFKYPCPDIQQGFYAIRISSTPVNCCRFLNSQDEPNFISSSIDGSICLWKLEEA